jgi:siroheme synthase-like protein
MEFAMSEKKQKYFPVFIDMNARSVLIVGAGEIASRRAGILADFGAEITVIAPDGTAEMKKLEAQKKVCWQHRACEAENLPEFLKQEWDMVLAATDDAALNSRIVLASHAAGILANNASDHSQCGFFFPAIVENDDLVIGVTSTRQDHRLVRRIAARLREWLKKDDMPDI